MEPAPKVMSVARRRVLGALLLFGGALIGWGGYEMSQVETTVPGHKESAGDKAYSDYAPIDGVLEITGLVMAGSSPILWANAKRKYEADLAKAELSPAEAN